MAQGDKMAKITLDYSLDDGDNFTGSALQITFERQRVYAVHRYEDKDPKHNGRIEQVAHSYIRLELQTTWFELDPAEDASGNANWLFLQKWLGAPIRRIAWDTTNFASAGGYTEFNSGTNANYVRIVSWEPDFIPSKLEDSLAQPSKRRFKMVLETRDEFTIT